MHPQAYTEIRNFLFSGIFGCTNLAFYTPGPESARYQYTVRFRKYLFAVIFVYLLRIDVDEIDLAAAGNSAVIQCFVEALV